MKHLTKQLLVVAALAASVQFNLARAGTHTWTGAGGNAYWNNAANWSGGAPTVGEAAPVVLIFPGSVAPVNNIVGLTVDSIRFNGSYTVLQGSGGGTLTFRGAGGTNLVFTANGSTNGIAASLPVTLSGSNYFYISSGHIIGIDSVISGAGILTIAGQGGLAYGGTQPNTATGKISVRDACKLDLGKPAGITAIAGPLEAGETGGRIRLRASNQIADSIDVTVDDGFFELNGFDDAISDLKLHLGEVTTGAGVLTVKGDIIPVSAGNTIWGQLSLGGATRTIKTTANDSLVIRANISNGAAAAGITKTGGGTVVLYGTNTFTGPVSVNGGTLQLHNNSALGSTAGGTTVMTNSILRLMGQNIGVEPLTLNGELEVYNTNNWAGPVTVSGAPVMDVASVASQLTLSQIVSGSGSVKKHGPGTLIFSGAQANTFTGGLTVNGGNVNLSKPAAVAVPGPLQISTGMVRLLQANQIADTVAVTVAAGTTLDLNNFSETIGSLAGNGSVNVGSSTLNTGGNNTSTTFGGVMSGASGAPLIKNGSGTFTLTGTNTCTGTTTVNSGSLVVNGVWPGGVALNNSGGLLGKGKVGNLTSASGNVHPGYMIGKLTTSTIALNNAPSTMNFEIAGPTPGTGHDQIIVNGGVTLNNATLNISAIDAGAVGNQYVLIANDGVDAVTGTFDGLPEGATITQGLFQYTISYHGGTGNDVVLTQTAGLPAPTITLLSKLPEGQMQITGKGVSGYVYQIEASSNLGTTNWAVLGSVEANWNGDLGFTDENASNFPQRFYRLRVQ